MGSKWIAAAALLASAVFGAGAAAHAQAEAQPAAWVTTADGASLLQPVQTGAWRTGAPSGRRVLRIDPDKAYQEIRGFGASITDSSAWLIQRKLSGRARAVLLQELFGREPGIGLSATRLTIGGSDFSRAHYSYSDRKGHFDLSAARRDVVPVARAAREVNPDLVIIASPWSAPAWMKSTGSLITGSLLQDHYGDFAVYLRDYVSGMARLGVRIDALTIQNEPHYEPADYPGMRMTPAERAAFVGGHLGPLLERSGVDVQLFEWDHNWDEPNSPLTMLADAVAARYVDGIAWHCYKGEVSAQSPVHAAHPDKSTWMTECSGGGWDADFRSVLGWMMGNLVIGATRNWAEGVVLWNLALDEQSGPHLGGCGNCRGVVTIDQATGRVTRNVEYYALAHASRFVRPGARRIESDSGVDGLASVAFRNSDGSIALIVHNAADAPREFEIGVGAGAEARTFSASLPAGAAATFTWAGERRDQ